MNKEPFANLPDVLNAKQLAEALHLSKAGAYNLLNADDFPTLKIGGRKLIMKQDLLLWLKKHTNGQERERRKTANNDCSDALYHLSEQLLFENFYFSQFKS